MQKHAFAGIAAALALASAIALKHHARPGNRSPIADAPPRTGASKGSLSGKVVDSFSHGISHARVCATCATCDPTVTEFRECTDSDDSGSFVLAALVPMNYRLAAAAKGFSPALARGGNAVNVAAAARATADVVLVPGGAALAGIASDAAGHAIPNAEIRLVHWQPPWIALGVRTDPAGRYEQWVSEGAWTASGIAEGYACSGVPAVAPSDDVAVVLAPGGKLKGVVALAQGAPAPGIEVTARLLAPNRSYVLSTMTSSDGSFALDSLEAGNYLVRAAGQGLRGEIPFVPVPARVQTASISIPVHAAARVTGRVVVGSRSAPCEEGVVTLGAPGADVLLRQGTRALTTPTGTTRASSQWGPLTTAQIDADGSVAFESVAPGRYYATVECRDHVFVGGPDVIDVNEQGARELVWRVEPGVGVDVHAVDELQRPVPGAELWLEGPIEAGVAGKSMPLPTDGAGRYVTPLELTPGLYTLKADWTHEANPVSLDLRHASGTVPATLTFAGSAAVSLTVRGSDGRALDGLMARARATSGALPAPGHPPFVLATPLGQGRYRIAPLVPGRYSVELTDELNPPITVTIADSTTVSVAAGSVAEASVVLDRSGAFGGRILDREGKGAAGVWVTLIPSPGPSAASPDPLALERSPRGRTLTDDAGRFVFPAIAPKASFTVLAEAADAFAVHHDARTGEALTLALQGSGTLNGTVALPDGSFADDFEIHAVEHETGMARAGAFQHAGGRFSLPGMVPGEIDVTVTTAAGYFAHAKVSLSAEQVVDSLRFRLVAPGVQPIAAQ